MEQLKHHLEHQKSHLDLYRDFFWHKLRSNYVIRSIQKFKPSAKSLLDIGAGAGIFGIHLKNKLPNIQYHFFEPIPELNKNLIHRFGSTNMSLFNAMTSEEVYTLLDVLEHIDDDQQFLHDINNKIPENSLLIVTCPALKILWSQWDTLMGHFRRYSKQELNDKLKQAGFEILESRYYFHSFILPGLFRKFSKEQNSEFPNLSAFVNSVFYYFTKIEAFLFRYLPFGTSVFVVARKSVRSGVSSYNQLTG